MTRNACASALLLVAVFRAGVAFGESELTISEFARNKISASIPLAVTVPSNLVPFDPENATETWWVTPEQAERLRQGLSTTSDAAHFTVKVTMNLGYDAEAGMFRDPSGTEKEMAATLRASGMKDVVVERHDPSGYPVLIVEITNPGGQRARLAYIAMKVGSNVLLMYLTPSDAHPERDQEVWQAFKSKLLGT